MDRVTLSGWQTFVWKYVFPLILLVPVLWVTGILFFAPERMDWSGGAAPWYAKWTALAISAFVLWLVRALCGPLKRVRVDERKLYVSNYFHEEEIPRAAVSRVYEARWIAFVGEHPIKVELNGDRGFFRSFSFFLARGLTYDDVEELS